MKLKTFFAIPTTQMKIHSEPTLERAHSLISNHSGVVFKPDITTLIANRMQQHWILLDGLIPSMRWLLWGKLTDCISPRVRKNMHVLYQNTPKRNSLGWWAWLINLFSLPYRVPSDPGWLERQNLLVLSGALELWLCLWDVQREVLSALPPPP